MSAVSDYLENKLLDHVFRNTAYTSPASVYLALYTSNPGDDNSGIEVSGGNYARQAVTFNAPSGGSITNSADISFPEATADWGTVTHFGIMDASTGGNLLWHGALDNSKSILTGDQIIIKAGGLTVSLS
mgnify:CR=1 FL=1